LKLFNEPHKLNKKINRLTKNNRTKNIIKSGLKLFQSLSANFENDVVLMHTTEDFNRNSSPMKLILLCSSSSELDNKLNIVGSEPNSKLKSVI